MARATYWESLGWIKRGEDYSSDTSEEQFAGMEEAHALALADAHQVLALKPDMILAYTSLISIASRRVGREAYVNGLKIDPASYLLRKAMLGNLTPRWGGSYKAIEALLEETKPYLYQNVELAALMGFADYSKALDEIPADREVKSIAYSTAAIEYGDKPYYYQRRADAYYRLGNFEAAIIDYSNALALYPYSANAYLWRGLAYKQLGQLDLSMPDLAQAAKLRPFDFDVRRSFGNALAKEKRYEEAVESYYAAMQYKKDDAELWYSTGWYLNNRLNRYKEALEAFNKATTLNPDKPLYWYET